MPLPPKPPHLPHKGPGLHRFRGFQALIIGFIVSTIVAIIFGFILDYFNIPITTILPALAPVWIGIMTLIFLMLKEH